MALHLTHWGAFEAQTDGKTLTDVRPYANDPDPYELISNITDAAQHPARIDRPYVRAGWLEGGPGPDERRGRDEYIPLEWDQALDLLAGELRRVYGEHGPTAVYGGSYGWASAGRFHHAQSQLKRFLSMLGGYTESVNNYSFGASEPFLPHVFAPEGTWEKDATSWPVIADHTELLVAFGGLPRKNSAISNGGNVHHDLVPWLDRVRRGGTAFVGISPIRDDMPPESEADWLPVRPGSDGALLQAIAHVLISEGLVDDDFVRTHCVGYDEFAASVSDTTPQWAAAKCGIDADQIVALARRMAGARTMLMMSWSMQRQPHGEHVIWLGLAVAALLGQIGLPGGGFGHGYASTNYIGHEPQIVPLPRFSKGHNPVRSFIPVARVADMLLTPGSTYPYNGKTMTYPDIKLVYWAGGNPFHHHQDLKRLRSAFTRPDTVVVHDSMWTSTARHADIVMPATLSIERNDFGSSKGESVLVPMPAMVAPYAEARDDFAILSGLSARLGILEQFAEGKSELEWVEDLYGKWSSRLTSRGYDVPSFTQFWAEAKPVEAPRAPAHQVMLADYREDPAAHPLRTPSGRIHLHSQEIADFDYDDCPGTPTWFEPTDWQRTDDYPLHLVANQPKTRLHSQLDVGGFSAGSKIQGREPIRIHTVDAAARSVKTGDVVKVLNDRGWCLAGVEISEAVSVGVVQLSTGAWYDPDEDGNCIHGNPNVLTTDVGTSQLGQGNVGQHAMVQIELHVGELPPLTVTGPPQIRSSATHG